MGHPSGPPAAGVAVIGGGAAGLCAAIAAVRAGAAVTILERLPRPGKKILATGGGRCNLSHEPLDPGVYTTSSPELVQAVLKRKDGRAIRDFFHGIFLATRVEDGRVYPAANQAASVLLLLDRELIERGTRFEANFEAAAIKPAPGGFSIAAADGRSQRARTVILATGGRSYPALGSNGSGYDLAKALGHRIVPPVPSAVPLLVKDRLCHALQGLKVQVRAAALIGGKPASEAEGDLLFTPYGLSGTAVLDVSEPLSIALNRDGRKDTSLAVDFVPDLPLGDLIREFRERISAGWGLDHAAWGLLPQKLASQAFSMAAYEAGTFESRIRAVALGLKDKRFAVLGTRGWNEAEFTSGGVDAGEVEAATLESRKRPGLFLAGEILDVQGPRGGYNLAWAWASGLIAGESAAARFRD